MTDRAGGKASLAVIFLTVFIDLLGFGMVLPLLPSYADEFAHTLNKNQIGLVLGLLMASFSAMQFIFAPLWGRLSDRVGRRPVIMVGLTASAICYVLFGVATIYRSLALLFVSRIGAGIAGATISTAQAYIADSTTLENRNKGMALIGAAFGLGFTLGPLLGVAATTIGNYGGLSPWPGYFAAILSAAALGIAIFALPESRVHNPAAIADRFSRDSLRTVLATPSVGMLIVTLFVAGLSFANLEATLSLLLKKRAEAENPAAVAAANSHPDTPQAKALKARITRDMLLVFAYIGIVLTIVQGGIVRRLATRVSEANMLTVGSAISIVGFVLMALIGPRGSMTALLAAATVEIGGFAMITPSLNSLISRRSDPEKQGNILGVAQSASALSRIFGPLIGLLLFYQEMSLPFWIATVMMCVVLGLVVVAVRSGHDFAPKAAGA